MAPEHPVSRLGAWEGFEVDSFIREQRRGRSWCVIRLAVQTDRRRCCSGCLRWAESIHGTELRPEA